MPKIEAPPGSRQRWKAFLRNHMHESLAIDFVVLPTITFEVIYALFVRSVDRRRIVHFNVTRHPTTDWTAQRVVEACGFEVPGRFLFRDNDKIHGRCFKDRVDGLGLTQVQTALRSPWHNPLAERWMGGLRHDCLDHAIALNEEELRRVIASYVRNFHMDRTHLELEKDTPIPESSRPAETESSSHFRESAGSIIATHEGKGWPRRPSDGVLTNHTLRVLGGLQHDYSAAA